MNWNNSETQRVRYQKNPTLDFMRHLPDFKEKHGKSFTCPSALSRFKTYAV